MEIFKEGDKVRHKIYKTVGKVVSSNEVITTVETSSNLITVYKTTALEVADG